MTSHVGDLTRFRNNRLFKELTFYRSVFIPTSVSAKNNKFRIIKPKFQLGIHCVVVHILNVQNRFATIRMERPPSEILTNIYLRLYLVGN